MENNCYSIFDKELTLSLIDARDSTFSEQTKRFSCSKGMRLYSRFFYVRNGKITFILKNTKTDEKLEAVKGDIVYLPHDVEYESVWENQNKIDFVTVLFKLTENGNIVNLADNIEIIVRDSFDLYLTVFEEIANIYKKCKVGYKFKGQSLCWKLLYDILLERTKKDVISKGGISEAVYYVENHFLGKIDVNSLAKKCNICSSLFRKKFREYVGMSPIEYKNYLKTKKAIELLSTDEYTVTEIAEAVGFSDAFYFCKVFKRFWGSSPKQFLKSLDK